MGIGENIIFIYEGNKEWQGVSSQIMNSTNKKLTDFIFASDLLKEMREAVTNQSNSDGWIDAYQRIIESIDTRQIFDCVRKQFCFFVAEMQKTPYLCIVNKTKKI